MNIVQLLVSILTSLAAIAGNPALGIGDAATQKIAQLMGVVTSLAAAGTAAYGALQALDAELKTIVASGAPPIGSEWDEFVARHVAAHARLQA